MGDEPEPEPGPEPGPRSEERGAPGILMVSDEPMDRDREGWGKSRGPAGERGERVAGEGLNEPDDADAGPDADADADTDAPWTAAGVSAGSSDNPLEGCRGDIGEMLGSGGRDIVGGDNESVLSVGAGAPAGRPDDDGRSSVTTRREESLERDDPGRPESGPMLMLMLMLAPAPAPPMSEPYPSPIRASARGSCPSIVPVLAPPASAACTSRDRSRSLAANASSSHPDVDPDPPVAPNGKSNPNAASASASASRSK